MRILVGVCAAFAAAELLACQPGLTGEAELAVADASLPDVDEAGAVFDASTEASMNEAATVDVHEAQAPNPCNAQSCGGVCCGDQCTPRNCGGCAAGAIFCPFSASIENSSGYCVADCSACATGGTGCGDQ